MYTIDNKFELGEECWSVYREKISYRCPVCNGEMEITYKGYKIPCPACDRKGFEESSKCAMTHCKVKIKRVIASIGENEVDIRYNVDPIGKNQFNINIKHRNESMLFKTEKEAIDYCIDVNKKETSSEF
jgi:DNA-directed RNA polymerase subunit RPC12/RpoP